MRNLTAIILLTNFVFACNHIEKDSSPNLTSWVDPFIGTGNASETEGMMSHFISGNVHPGALVPWGMVTFAPRNLMAKTDVYCGSEVLSELPTGFRYGEEFIYGFSQVLISGSGCPAMGNVLVMPTTGDIYSDFKRNKSSYKNEVASPGYYGVSLKDPEIEIESTVTSRTSLSKYIFKEKTDAANILIDLYHSLIAPTDAYLNIVSDTEIEGWCLSGCFCNKETIQKIHFVIRFNKAFETFGTYNNLGVHSGKNTMRGIYSGAYARFNVEQKNAILMKTGISYVSIDNARENLNAEQAGWDFEEMKNKAKIAWEEQLSRIQVEGGTADQKKIFYTALYHALLHPNVFNDVNGEYIALGSQDIKSIGENRKNHYTVYSLWDTYRNLHPLLTLLYPERQLEMVKTMVDMYKTSGYLPKWEINANESNVMVGDPSCPVITDTYIKGVQDFDVQSAYEAMVKSSDLTENNLIRQGNGAYNEFGYIPFDHSEAVECWGVTATSLEYNYADWCIAQLAKSLGKEEDYKRFYSKSMGYKLIYDENSSFLVPKNKNGSVIENFNIDTLRGSLPGDWESGGPGYVEGNAWQYNFFVPHDIPGLADLMGTDNFIDKLQSCFHYPERFMLFNEPDMAYPYLFDYIEGEGWRSQKEIRKAMEKYFNTSPGGLPGNDDCGTLSAWYIFSAMGFYPACPGSSEYQIGSPLFDKITLKLDPYFYPAEELIIECNNNSQENFYVRSVSLNGKSHTVQTIAHEEIINGGQLIFEMGANPGINQ